MTRTEEAYQAISKEKAKHPKEGIRSIAERLGFAASLYYKGAFAFTPAIEKALREAYDERFDAEKKAA